MALATDSTVWTRGNGGDGQLGNAANVAVDAIPDPIPFLDSIVKIAAGEVHALALQSNDTIWAWGKDDFGQLGNNDTNIQYSPDKVVPFASGIDSIEAGRFHSFALLNNGDAYGWGRCVNGELGNGGMTNVLIPNQIPNLPNIKTLSGGLTHSIALHFGDTVSVWGGNLAGQLGDNSLTEKLTPVPLIGLCPTYVDLRDTVITNYFRPTAFITDQWTAGELASSIPLPSGKRMYLMGHSQIEHLSNDSVPCSSPDAVKNCILVQDEDTLSILKTWLDPDTSLTDRSYFRDTVNPTNFYQPGHGYVQDDSTAYVFLSKFRNDSTFLGNDIGVLRIGITTYLLEDINRIMPNNTTLDFGTAVIVDGNHVHAYGNRLVGDIRRPYIARRVLADTSATWEYYDTLNHNWSSNITNAKPISTYNVAEHFSVTEIQGWYYLVSHDQAPDITTCSDHRNIIVYRSSSITGPFSEPTLVYVTPETLGIRKMLSFNAFAHPDPASCDSLIISYNVHDVGSGTCISQCDNGGQNQIADTWRPQFIRVPYDSIDPQLQPIPLPVANFTDSISGGTVWFTNNSDNGAAYLWYFGDGDSSQLFNPVHVYDTAGTYTVTLIVIGCYGLRDTVKDTINPFVGIAPSRPTPTPQLSIFPNPSSGDITLRADAVGSKPVLVEVFTNLGIRQYAQSHKPINGKLEVRLDNGNLDLFPCPGLYHIRLSNGSFSATRAVSIVHGE
ncbi:MAG: PKD domain-containing protein [Bacteroidia bacterium]